MHFCPHELLIVSATGNKKLFISSSGLPRDKGTVALVPFLSLHFNHSLSLSHTHRITYSHTYSHTHTQTHTFPSCSAPHRRPYCLLWLIMHRLAPGFIFNPVFLHFSPAFSGFFLSFSLPFPAPTSSATVSSSGVRVGERVWVYVCVCSHHHRLLLCLLLLLLLLPQIVPPFLFVIFRFRQQHFGHRSSLLLYLLSCTCVCVCVRVSSRSPSSSDVIFCLLFSVCLHFCVCLCV